MLRDRCGRLRERSGSVTELAEVAGIAYKKTEISIKNRKKLGDIYVS